MPIFEEDYGPEAQKLFASGELSAPTGGFLPSGGINIPSGPFDPNGSPLPGGGVGGRFPRRGPYLPPDAPSLPRPREERFDQLGRAGAGQGFLTPFGETKPQRFRNRPDQIGGSGAAAFSEFQTSDPLDIYKNVVDKANLGIEKNAFLDMSPFQQFLLNERAKRKLGIRGRKRGPGRPPKRPRPFPFPRPTPRGPVNFPGPVRF